MTMFELTELVDASRCGGGQQFIYQHAKGGHPERGCSQINLSATDTKLDITWNHQSWALFVKHSAKEHLTTGISFSRTELGPRC
jgi:hypothetical protein